MNQKLKIDKIFSDGMILQRDTNNKIYGYDIPGQKIQVSIGQLEHRTYAGPSGYWEVILGKKENSGPFEMVIQGSSKRKIGDLYFGEVFLLGGQSNMELPISRVFDLYEEELQEDLESYKQPIIRQFTMAKEYAFKKDNGVIASGEWIQLGPTTMTDFSAIGYFFGKHFGSYHKGLNIGLIQTAVGGSPIEAWCNEELIKKYRKNHLKELDLCRHENYIINKIQEEEECIQKWAENLLKKDVFKDAFIKDFSKSKNPNKIRIPIKYDQVEELRSMNGIVWLQKKLYLTSATISKINKEETYLHLGTIVDADQVWVNGIEVGSTSYQYPPRKYRIPRGILRVGKNIITIKHYIHASNGEFTATKPYHIKTKSKNVQISIRGEWYYKIGATTTPQPSMTFFTRKPTALYHTMIDPLKKAKIKGVLWYQGESNVDDGEEYGLLFQEMIKLFREDFQDEDLPFAFVQLTSYGLPQVFGPPGPWANFRHDQEKVTSLKNAAMVVSIDQGEALDIHPIRKKVIGKRLAASMESLINHECESYKGPILKAISEKDKGWTLKFRNTADGLEQRGPLYFSLYCETQEGGSGEKNLKWIGAKGVLEARDEIWVKKPKGVLKTYKISYADLDNPRYIGLYNKEGFPSKPFVYSFHNE